MRLEKFLPSERDTWTWSLADYPDVIDIVAMAEGMFQKEIETFMQPDPVLFARNLTISIAKQHYSAYDEHLVVARDNNTQELIAWAWLARGSYTTYSRDEMAEGRFAHMDLALPVRTRITLLAQILYQWYRWCQICAVPILVSTSIREDQRGFMNLHQAAGFTVRGSIGYLKI
jgi:hypothetical protein